MAVVTVVSDPNGGWDLSQLPGGSEFPGGIKAMTPELYLADFGYGGTYRLIGSGLTYDEEYRFSGGVVTGWTVEWNGPTDVIYSITGFSVPATSLRYVGGAADVLHPYDTRTYNVAPILFAGDDSMTGDAGGEAFSGFAGNDVIVAGGGADTINGNQGDDSCAAGAGNDLLHGGKDDDSLNGNGGNDTLFGDLGDDTLHGGQGADNLTGGDGNDWLYGELGDDTISGGAGADVFETWAGAGHDRVLDFAPAEGDRIKLDEDDFVLIQMGDDTVIDMGRAQLVLIGVSSANWQDWTFQ